MVVSPRSILPPLKIDEDYNMPIYVSATIYGLPILMAFIIGWMIVDQIKYRIEREKYRKIHDEIKRADELKEQLEQDFDNYPEIVFKEKPKNNNIIYVDFSEKEKNDNGYSNQKPRNKRD
jgi:hypothetical protein